MNTLRGAKQDGLTMVEFSIVGLVFFILLFGCFEVGRLLFTWNSLNEVTRRAARLAAVCPVNATAAIQNTAIFGGTIVSGLDPEDVIISYLDRDGDVVGNVVGSFTTIVFVQARIGGDYQFRLIVPTLSRLFSPPAFSTTVIAESLGISPTPDAGITVC